MSRLLDPKSNGRYPFQYRSAALTDVRLTIAKAKRELAEQALQTSKVVRPIKVKDGR